MQYKDMRPFRFWSQKVLPLVYDDSISYYEVLCKMVSFLNDMADNQDEFAEELKKHGVDLQNLHRAVDELRDILEGIKNGEYAEMYEEAMTHWFDNYGPELVGRLVRYVFFGLTDDGRFCAYIPDSWDFLDFDTDMDSKKSTYGHLILRW